MLTHPYIHTLQLYRCCYIGAAVVGLVGEVDDDLLHNVDPAQEYAFVQPLVAFVPEIRRVVHR